MNLKTSHNAHAPARIPALLIYAFLWIFFLIIPVITGNYGEGKMTRILYDWLRLAPFFIVFLFNHLLFLPRILFIGYVKSYLFVLVFFILLISYFFQAAGPFLYSNDPDIIEYRMLRDPQYGREEMRPGPPVNPSDGGAEIFRSPSETMRSVLEGNAFYNFVNIFLISLLIAGFNTAISMTNRWINEEQARREAEREHIKSELAFLQNQISPHFFMNTLNNIHAMVETSPEKARDSILRLSTLMRYLLYDSGRGSTTLKKEIEFIRSYVSLMQLRFDRSIEIDLNLPESIPDLKLPPLLFISFIENAFKHGISYMEHSSIEFSIELHDNALEFRSFNTVPKNQPTFHGYGGVGLENIRKRLDLIYGNKYKLDINKTDHEFNVVLFLPFETEIF
jgi:hypothetical protein